METKHHEMNIIVSSGLCFITIDHSTQIELNIVK